MLDREKLMIRNVLFPAIDLVLAVFFSKLAAVYFDYRKQP